MHNGDVNFRIYLQSVSPIYSAIASREKKKAKGRYKNLNILRMEAAFLVK